MLRRCFRAVVLDGFGRPSRPQRLALCETPAVDTLVRLRGGDLFRVLQVIHEPEARTLLVRHFGTPDDAVRLIAAEGL